MAARRKTRPDRILYPETGFTRDDAVAYYRGVAKVLLPHLKKRPLSFKRFPDTINGESFWEKDAPSFTPSWVQRVAVPRRRGESDIEYIVVNDVRTLTWLASVGGIEIHPFLHRAPHIDEASDVVFDLDPGSGATIVHCCRVAVILRDALDAIGLQPFVKASGSKGLQVYVPLHSGATHDASERFARLLAEELAKRHPKLIVARMTKSVRAKKVFIDCRCPFVLRALVLVAPCPAGGGERVPKAGEGPHGSRSTDERRIVTEHQAPHPAFGHLLPAASGEKGNFTYLVIPI